MMVPEVEVVLCCACGPVEIPPDWPGASPRRECCRCGHVHAYLPSSAEWRFLSSLHEVVQEDGR